MSTLTIVRKNGTVAMATDALTTFEETKLPPGYDAAPEKIMRVGDALIGVVGYTAHFLVIESILASLPDADFSSRTAIFETFRALHPILKEEYFLNPEAEEGDPYESSQIAALVASPHGIFGVYDLREVHEYTRFWAMGSGTSFALGAMFTAYDEAATASEVAELGVRAGAEFDRNSSLPVQAYEVVLAH